MASPEASPIPAPFDEVDQAFIDAQNETASDGESVPLWRNPSFLAVEVRLVLTALAIIYVGAHASLRRPPSAAPAKPRGGSKSKRKKEEDEPFTQGLLPSDAILFPIIAGIILVGLYYLIQWLQDPAILSTILRGYMSVVGVASLASLVAHALQLGFTFLFPRYYRSRGTLYEIDGVEEGIRPAVFEQSPEDEGQGSGNSGDEEEEEEEEGVVVKKSEEAGESASDSLAHLAPLTSGSPSPFRILKRLSPGPSPRLWELRHLLLEEWTVRFRLHGFFREKFSFQFSHMLGCLISLVVVFAYNWTNSKGLSNLMGYGLCYGAFLMLSPTDFTTGTLVLVGLFFYDIAMVFYTPYMITVATKIDAPMKLSFESASRSSMLGLGDIVVPGIVMCLALRFDLWRYYQKQARHVPTELSREARDATSGDVVVARETAHVVKKAPFLDLRGSWADCYWSSAWFAKPAKDAPDFVRAAAFPKTYFYASLTGYLLGMIVTLTMLLVFKRGQPALLYLVPGVLGSLWLTGLIRGELKDMLTFTEDGTLDTQDVIVELDENGNVVKEVKKDSKGDGEDAKRKKDEEGEKATKKAAKAKKLAAERARDGYDVFHFSIRAPPRTAAGRKAKKGETLKTSKTDDVEVVELAEA